MAAYLSELIDKLQEGAKASSGAVVKVLDTRTGSKNAIINTATYPKVIVDTDGTILIVITTAS